MRQVLQLNENVIRVNAFFTFVIASLTLFLQYKFVVLFLAVDFFIRGFSDRTSPLSIISKFIVRMLDLQYIPIYAPPKKFAAKVGFILSMIIFVFYLIQCDVLIFSFTGIFILCAFLEAFLKICVGCYVFNWLIKPISSYRIKKTGKKMMRYK